MRKAFESKLAMASICCGEIIKLEKRLIAYQKELDAIRKKLCNKQVPRGKKEKLHFRLGFIIHVGLPDAGNRINKIRRSEL